MKDIKQLFEDLTEKETNILPITGNFEGDLSDEEINDNKEIPILSLRNTVLFPGIILPITVGRQKSLKLIRESHKNNNFFGCVSQTDPNIENPEFKDLNKIGTFAKVIKILEMPDNTTTVIIQGRQKLKIDEWTQDKPYFKAKISAIKETYPSDDDLKFDALSKSLKDLSLKIIKLSVNIPTEATFAIKNIEDNKFLINFICSNTDININEKQKLLEIDDVYQRGTKLLEILSLEIQKLELKQDIQLKVKTDLDKQQREFILHQQLKTIQEELGGNPLEHEIEDLKKKGKKKKWNKEIAKTFNDEVEKLRRLNPASPEYSVQINYLETIVSLPWNEYTKDNFDLDYAQKILDKDHFGLENVKDRILEHLAVIKLKGDLKSPIICLYGPPGVGKTSLGKSVAKALNRKYVRMSLGGLHDESEIRGHRKTYIGAMPGRIIQNIKKAGSSNPVFILDEIDKIGQDFRGDPSSALLEVLDPEQNSTFHDNFLDLDYDLSKVLFIATANNISTISPALRDRMEMIEVNGYVVEEKIEIAKRHLIPKQLENHGVKKSDVKLSNKIIETIIGSYTKESGVRNLDKTLAKIARNIAKNIAFNKPYNKKLTEKDIVDILGYPKFKKDIYEGNDYAGVVTGLAWTSVGGVILFVETSLNKGKGKLTLTGNLGDVMKESAVIALQWIKANADKYKIKPDFFEKWDIHVHFPEGATPKDGPSAGITLITSLLSAITRRKVKRNIAMTGEITLRGKVLPVGGIKEKILAAKRANIKEIILSQDNKKDILEINEKYIKGLKFHYVKDIAEVINLALLKQKVNK